MSSLGARDCLENSGAAFLCSFYGSSSVNVATINGTDIGSLCHLCIDGIIGNKAGGHLVVSLSQLSSNQFPAWAAHLRRNCWHVDALFLRVNKITGRSSADLPRHLSGL